MKISGSGIFPLLQNSRAGRLELHWLRSWGIPVMVLNEGMVEEALTHGFSRDQLVWMPNPVDIGEFRPAEPGEAVAWRERQGIPADRRVVTYAGRLSSEKGLTDLLHGFAMAVRSMPDATLVLVGDGVFRPALEHLAQQLKVLPDQIRFVGRVDVAEVPFWLRASDVFALTSPNEGFPCALVEAMASGLPSVVSNIPANRQLVEEGVHGLTVPVNDFEAIGSALLRLFRDPALRCDMGRAARECVVNNYSTEKVVQRYEELFQRIMMRQPVLENT
jgi:glycosyltransferase involved in cell wall biosynthesis